MIWIYVFTILLAPLLFFVARILPWLYRVHITIRNAYLPFLVVKPHWLYGHVFIHRHLTEEGLMDNLEWTKKSSHSAYAFFLPFGQSLSLSHPDVVKKVLRTAEPKGFIPATGSSYKLLVPWLGDGLLTSKGQKWTRNRRLLTPGFHFDVLKPYMVIYNECTEKLIQRLSGLCSDGQSVEIFSMMSLLTLNIILKCAFSVDENVQDLGDKVPYVKTVYDLGRLIIERMYRPHWFINAVYFKTRHGREFKKLCNFSHAYARQVIENRRNQLKQGEDPSKRKKYLDFLDILLLAKDEDGAGLTQQEIQDEVETFMFEAHDTTACGLSWLLYNLARHPEIQRKAQQEIDELLKDREGSELNWEDMNNVPYLTRCIKESLRTHPPAHAVDRELTRPLDINGYTIPPGSIVEINIFNVHHNPKVWGDDWMAYNPDRFLSENMEKMDSYAFIPFSAGPRNCIGQVFAMNELKTTASKILWKFDIAVDETHPVRMKPDLLLRSENGVKLHFRERCH